MKGCAKFFVVAAGLCFLSCAGIIWIGARNVGNTRSEAQPKKKTAASLPIDVPQQQPSLNEKMPKESIADTAEDTRDVPLSGFVAEDILSLLRSAGYSVNPQVISVAEAKRMSVMHRFSWTCTDPSFSGELKRRSVFLEGDGPDAIHVVEVSVMHPSLSPVELRTESEKVMATVAKVVLGPVGEKQVRDSLIRLGKNKANQSESGAEMRFITGDRGVWISATKWARSMGIYAADPQDIADQTQKVADDLGTSAAKKLDLAKPFIKRGDSATARGRLREIIDRFPGTSAAEEAAELLKTLD